MNLSGIYKIKTHLIILLACFTLFSCAPVLSEHLMKDGIYDIPLSEIRQNPGPSSGKLYIFGGIIVKTTVTNEGSLIEALFVPVNSMGFLKGLGPEDGRFLALYKGKKFLDPLIFGEKREITLAGEFVGLRKGRIDEAEYSYPFFEIKEVYLWEEMKQRDYYNYPPYHYRPWYYHQRFRDPYYPYDPWRYY